MSNEQLVAIACRSDIYGPVLCRAWKSADPVRDEVVFNGQLNFTGETAIVGKPVER